jgi:LacI family transcriptional regulator
MSRSRTPPSGDRRATVKTVAERAGVSVATVSRVLNGRLDSVTAGTRERVLEAARELSYVPNSVAVALRVGVTKTIGLIIPDISDSYFHQVARGVEDVAQEAGYAVVFCNTDRKVEKESLTLDLLRDKRADGIIFCGGGVDDEGHLQRRDWGTAKVVAIGPHVVDLPSIRVDDAAAIRAAVEHLAATGRRRILCIAGEPEWLVTQRRLAGYRAAVEELQLDDDPHLTMYAGFATEDGQRAVADAVRSKLSFDAVLAFDDDAALGALVALREASLRVPEDVSLVGCDDVPFARLATPSLTSIHWPLYDFGTTAARMVLDMLAAKPVPQVVEFPFELVVRASSSPEQPGNGRGAAAARAAGRPAKPRR